MSLGLMEIIIVLVIALLVFGAKRLPEVGKSLGQGLKEFKKGLETGIDSTIDINDKDEK